MFDTFEPADILDLSDDLFDLPSWMQASVSLRAAVNCGVDPRGDLAGSVLVDGLEL